MDNQPPNPCWGSPRSVPQWTSHGWSEANHPILLLLVEVASYFDSPLGLERLEAVLEQTDGNHHPALGVLANTGNFMRDKVPLAPSLAMH